MDGSTSNGVAKISEKMHLLHRTIYFRSIGTLPQVLTDIYNNFISMANVVERAFRDKITTTHTSPNPITHIWELKYLMGFIRSALKWCVHNVGTINWSLINHLTRIEANFIEVSHLLLGAPSSDESVLVENHGDRSFDLNFQEQEILDAYLFIWKHCIPLTFMFTEESVMERLDQAIEDDHRMHKKQCVIMKRFIHFIKEYADQAILEDVLPWVDYLLDMMTCYFLHYNMKGPSSDIAKRLDAAIHCIVLHIFNWHSKSRPPFTAELMVAYVECFQDNLSWLLNEECYNLAEHPKQLITIIHNVLRSVLSLLRNTPKYGLDELDTSLKQLGSIISSFFAFELDGNETSFQIQDLLVRTFDDVSSVNQFKFNEELLDMSRIVFYQWSDCDIKSEMLLNSRVEILRILGSIICSSLVNKAYGKTETEMNCGQPELLSKVESIKQVTRKIFIKIFKCLRVKAPQIYLLGFFDFLLENLEELRVRNSDLVRDWKDQLQTIQGDLVVFRSFQDKSIGCNSSGHISVRIANAAYDAEYIIYAFIVGAFPVWCRSFIISDLIEQFSLIKDEIIINGSIDVLPYKPIPTTNLEKDAIRMSSRASAPSTNVVVGFEIVMNQLMDRLANGGKHLDVISVVGMAGIGKTTLATKVYSDPYSMNHFQVRAWCVVSNDYDKKDLLLRILGSDGNRESSYEELGDVLHKKLFGRRYLIVLDDVWDIDAFNSLKRYFPNVGDGSRVVLTSRAVLTGHESNPIKLSLLSDDQSWNMLKEIVYTREEVPVELLEIGIRIAKKCGGLPLAVVVVAGLLSKSDKDQDVWKEIAERLSIYRVAGDTQEEGMKALDLSYELLPDHLKPLFLYIGAFPEDSSMSTKTLKRLWIAEGFIRKSEKRSQEDGAETYLMDLIDRSLLMVDKRSSAGLVKTCRIHDLMRDMALSKAKEENFFKCIIGNYKDLYDEHVKFERRVCIGNYPSVAKEAPPVHGLVTYDDLSVLSIPSSLTSVLSFTKLRSSWEPGERIFEKHKLLRVFHVDKLEFNDEVTLPIHLRYIKLWLDSNIIPASVFNLWDLETLILTGDNYNSIIVPGEVWKMAKLRHLDIKSGFEFSDVVEECCSKLDNLQTLSTLRFKGEEETMKLIGRFPNLVKLKCEFLFKNGRDEWPRLETLHQLQSLNVWCRFNENGRERQCNEPQFSRFPSTLKKLSLYNFCLEWKDISKLQQELPNLEILKLQVDSVEDELWDMGDGVFPKLKFLKLEFLNIKRWIASEENFPCLENLVLHVCHDLEEIPLSFGEIDTLKKIELNNCSHSASESAKRIEKQQIEEYGNEQLKVYVSHPFPPRPQEMMMMMRQTKVMNQIVLFIQMMMMMRQTKVMNQMTH